MVEYLNWDDIHTPQHITQHFKQMWWWTINCKGAGYNLIFNSFFTPMGPVRWLQHAHQMENEIKSKAVVKWNGTFLFWTNVIMEYHRSTDNFSIQTYNLAISDILNRECSNRFPLSLYLHNVMSYHLHIISSCYKTVNLLIWNDFFFSIIKMEFFLVWFAYLQLKKHNTSGFLWPQMFFGIITITKFYEVKLCHDFSMLMMFVDWRWVSVSCLLKL